MNRFLYEGERTKEISFPLGGIGTGCIGLAGNGRLIDWEIFNRPNKGNANSFTHFAVKAESSEGRVIDARVLQGDLQPSYMGNARTYMHSGYGFGPSRTTMAGMPNFQEVQFLGEFPIADVTFADEQFPGQVRMSAFNPFIPLNDQDSSIPGAFFDIEIENTSEEQLSYTINFAVANPFKNDSRFHRYEKVGTSHLIQLSSFGYEQDHPSFGDLTVATDASDVSYQEYWYRGDWFDNLEIYWNEFASPGKFTNRTYDEPSVVSGDNTDLCSLAAHFELSPGESKSVRFVLTWNIPNCTNYWNPEKCDSGKCEPETWKNYYATQYENSRKSAEYSLENWSRLLGETMIFKEALFSSALPTAALDAVAANISILKSPTCLRLTDGSFYGFEGCMPDAGCCEGSCTHVWNYAYALPFLFPKLERSMRDLDFRHNQREDGRMSFRLQLPVGRTALNHRACVDGQFGGVIKAYRDWKISGDNDWLKSNWSAIKKSIEYAWAETNEDRWDANRDGVIEGRQHHTLDVELFGPNSWLNGFYLAALKAGSEMAAYLDEAETAESYLKLFEQGKAWTDKNLFNGKYYQQIIDIKDRTMITRYNDEWAHNFYWNSEVEEIKYQIADGCGVDQVIGQWHANLCGLGTIHDKEQTRSALASIYANNFKKSMRNVVNPCRLYSLNDEAGVVICEWPSGTSKPKVPLTYAQETMNGFEYQAAVHMIQEGMVEEGLEIVEAIRDRYDGMKRNPWNEFECGSNYARSMASYSLLLALSGFEYDMVKGMIGFNPVQQTEHYSTFWSLDSGWGIFTISQECIELQVLYGVLDIKTVRLPFSKADEIKSVRLGNKPIHFDRINSEYIFDDIQRLDRSCSLKFVY